MSDLSALLYALTDIPLQVGVATLVTFILRLLIILSQPIICNIQACFLTKRILCKKKSLSSKTLIRTAATGQDNEPVVSTPGFKSPVHMYFYGCAY
jgi:hypothetical protein